MCNNGILIAFSGIDGSGKSTQLKRFRLYCLSTQRDAVSLWTRGGYTQGVNTLKDFSRKLAGEKLPPSGKSEQRDRMMGTGWVQKVWLTLAILDLMWIYGVQIRSWLIKGKVVICDRYLWDTMIDFQIMFPDISIDKWLLWRVLVRVAPKPNIQFLLMIPLVISQSRCKQKYDPFPDTPETRYRRFSLYLEAMNRNRCEWKVIDATQSIDKVFSEIRNYFKLI